MSVQLRNVLLKWLAAIVISLIIVIPSLSSPNSAGMAIFFAFFGPAVVFGLRYALHYALAGAGFTYRTMLSILIWIPTDLLGRIFQILICGTAAVGVAIIVFAMCGIVAVVQGIFALSNAFTGNDVDLFKSKFFTILDKSPIKSKSGSASTERPESPARDAVKAPTKRRTESAKVKTARYHTDTSTIRISDGRVFTVDINNSIIFDEDNIAVDYDPDISMMKTSKGERIRLYLDE